MVLEVLCDNVYRRKKSLCYRTVTLKWDADINEATNFQPKIYIFSAPPQHSLQHETRKKKMENLKEILAGVKSRNFCLSISLLTKTTDNKSKVVASFMDADS